ALIGDGQLPSASSRREKLFVEGHSYDRPRVAVAVPGLDRPPPSEDSTTGRGADEVEAAPGGPAFHPLRGGARRSGSECLPAELHSPVSPRPAEPHALRP